MAGRDVLQRGLDAAGNAIENLGNPTAARDATFTDNATAPKPIAGTSSPGASLLAAPADHQHATAAPMRVAASGTTVIAAGARVTLATFKRNAGELFTPGGYAFVRDDKDATSWENEVDGATHIGVYHERTGTPNELRFRAINVDSSPRTVDWATVALATA